MSYIPSFRGIHYARRCKAWLVLLDRQILHLGGLRVRELSLKSNNGYASLRTAFTWWIRNGYIGCYGGKYNRIYRLRKRGRKWLIRWWDVMPLERYLDELEDVEKKKL